MSHREDIKAWLGTVHLENVHVIDWGRGTKPVTKYVRMGGGVTYFGIDKLPHVGADLVCDMIIPYLLQRIADVAFCMEVLEHVTDPDALVLNIAENLKAGGKLYMSVPFQFPVHSPEDYWRFTDQGIKLLLSRHGFEVESIAATEGDAGWLVRAVKLSPN